MLHFLTLLIGDVSREEIQLFVLNINSPLQNQLSVTGERKVQWGLELKEETKTGTYD